MIYKTILASGVYHSNSISLYVIFYLKLLHNYDYNYDSCDAMYLCCLFFYIVFIFYSFYLGVPYPILQLSLLPFIQCFVTLLLLIHISLRHSFLKVAFPHHTIYIIWWIIGYTLPNFIHLHNSFILCIYLSIIYFLLLRHKLQRNSALLCLVCSRTELDI